MFRLRPLLRVTICWAVALMGDQRASSQGSADDLVPFVLQLLEEKDKDLRALGLEQVRTGAPGAAATRQFASLLPKLQPEAQVGLLAALAARGDTAARTSVLELLQTSDPEAVRVAAIAAIARLGIASDAKVLIGLLRDGTEAAQTAAREGLVRFGDEGVAQQIVAEMKSAPPSLQATLIEILATRRALEAVGDLLPLATHDDPVIRSAAMAALGELAGPEHLPAIVDGVLRAEPGRERVAAEKAVMFVCERIEDAQRRAEPLLAVIDRLAAADALAVLPTLGRVGGKEALARVEAALSDPDPKRHEIGLNALCNWPNSSVAERLLELAQHDPHSEHRLPALKALIRVAPLPDRRPAAEKLALLERAMALCTRDKERKRVLERASAIRIVETLRFLLPYIDQPAYAEQACQSVVELAHHRGLREPNKQEFHHALDKVIETSQDATVVHRAGRYKRGQTWAKPTN